MSMRSRPLHVCAVVALLGSVLTTLVAGGLGAVASPIGRVGAPAALSQADTSGYPQSATVEGEDFLFDRMVPLDRRDFQRIERQGDVVFHARTEDPPFDALYALIPGRGDDGLARYLPTRVGSPDAPCPAEAANVGPLTAGDSTYVFAGIETDIPVEALEQIAEVEGQPVYADPGAAQPSPDLFLASDQGLLRFLIADDQGRPVAVPDGVPFAGQLYAFGGDVTDQTDPATLAKVGCMGSFPAFASTDLTEPPFAELFVLAAGRYLSFTATGPAPEEDITEASPEPTDGGDAQPTIASSDATTEPIDAEATPAEEAATEEPADAPATPEEEPDASLPLEVTEGLSGAGQPEGLPRELTLDGARYLFDRVLPLGTDGLTEVAQGDAFAAFARATEGPFAALYLTIPNGTGDQLARYLPEHLDTPDTQCPAETANLGRLDANGLPYAFAGTETDLTADLLQEVGDSNGQPIYADPGASEPIPELFVGDPAGLYRFVVLGEDGRPAVLAESLAFAGIDFAFAGDVTDQIDPGTLTKVGCAGPYPVYALPEEAGSQFTQLHVLVGGRLLQFQAGETPAEATPEPELPTETAVPTDVPTETAVPTDVPTETPVPTEAPTETAVPTDTPAPTETSVPTETPAPTEAPTETPVPTETTVPTETAAPTEVPAPTGTPVPATATAAPTEEATATELPQAAEEANLPPQIEVRNTSYVFNQVSVDVDVQTLVQVEVIVVNNVELTVYATEDFQGVTGELYCVSPDGQVVGQYVVAASANPTPPVELPPTIEAQGGSYAFNEVEVEIDVQTLVQVEVIVVENVELTIYADQEVQGQPQRLFAVAPGGQVVGQYVSVTLVVEMAQPQPVPTPTPQLEAPAVVPTLPPDEPPPPAATAIPTNRCAGDPGPLNARGVPSRLPNRIQLGGVSYAFVRTEAPDEAGTLTRIGCVGPFEVASTDQADRSEVLYLRVTEEGEASGQVYRFEAAKTFQVQVETTDRPRVINVSNQPERRYQLIDTWVPSLYSSVSVILFVDDPENPTPDVIYAVNVHDTVVGEVIGEYRLPGETDEPSQEMVEAAEQAEINPDLTINGERYLLVAIHYPVGTTTNGFVTIFSAEPDGDAEIVLGRDKRRLELFIYRSSETPPAGG